MHQFAHIKERSKSLEDVLYSDDSFVESSEDVQEDVQEVIQTQEQLLTEESSVSDNEVNYQILSELQTLNERVGESNVYLERLLSVTSDNSIRDSVHINNVSDNQAESITVSESSIIDKPINEYNVQEGLLLMIVVGLFMGAIVLIVKKGVGRWR